MPRSLTYTLAAMLMFLGSSAWSDCACFCVAGELKTLCTSVADAQDEPRLCPPADVARCPMDDGASTGTTYESPDSGAINCRDLRVYDATQGEYVNARACDVI